MTEYEFRKMFPKASVAFTSLNMPPLSSPQNDNKTPSNGLVARSKGKRRGLMNRVEREFAMILQSQKQQGEILRYDFEGITLRWPVGDQQITYTADFSVFCRAYIKLIEIKGPYIKGKFERAIERFRHAKTFYGDVFLFELWQKTSTEGWKRLL